MEMNKRVAVIRKRLGLSQEAFGENLGMGRSAISKIEKGYNELTEKNITLICKQFGISKSGLILAKERCGETKLLSLKQ